MSEPSPRMRALLGIKKKTPQNPLVPPDLFMQWVRWTYYPSGSQGFCYNTRPIGGPGSRHEYMGQPVQIAIRRHFRFKPWAAWKIRINKRRGTYTAIGQAVFFARRKKAAEKARHWYEKAQRKKHEAIASRPSWRTN